MISVNDRHPKTLAHAFIVSMRSIGRHAAFIDANRTLSGRRALAGAVALADALSVHWGSFDNAPRVGVMLPPSVGGALANAAAALKGRAVVNVNYTMGQAGVASALKQSGITKLLTSKLFLRKAGLELPSGVTPLWLEDVAGSIGAWAKLAAFLKARFLPAAWLAARADPEDTASVLFSSGSTGDPKGVELSHTNILSNVDAAGAALEFRASDRILHVLPLFHSFGTMLFWAGVRHRAELVFSPNPLDAAVVAETAETHRPTVFCATPTFLQLYLKRVPPSAFATLRMILTGAEKLPRALAEAVRETFGVPVLEGYGCTECSPVVSVNTALASRPGSVGRPISGVEAMIVAADSFEMLPGGAAGMLLVRGPNVMKGYLGRPDLTAQAKHHDWYITGDIARIDEEGFIHITGRLSRFSKIGGEMVPHGTIEEALHTAARVESQTFAVTAIADERRGERLIVVHVWHEEKVEWLCDALRERGLPNLFIPKASDFRRVDALPVLGSGKLDLQALRRLAAESGGS